MERRMWRGALLGVYRARWLGASFGLAATMLGACGQSYDEEAAPLETPDSGLPDASPAAPTDARDEDREEVPREAAADVENAVVDGGWPFADPSFQTDGTWQVGGGATLYPGGEGSSDLGFAHLAGGNLAFGSVSQRATIPAPRAGERPALDVRYYTYRTVNFGCGIAGPFADGQPLATYVCDRFQADGHATQRFCLGEAAWGGPRDFSIRAMSSDLDPLEVDSVAYVSDADCPAANGFANGDFERSSSWELPTPYDHARYSAGTGARGSRSLRLQVTSRNNVTAATQQILVPKTSMTAPAFRFHQSGEGVVSFGLDGAIFATTRTTGPAETKTVCFPDWSRGIASTFGIYLGADGNYVYKGEWSMLVDLDDFELVDEPTCSPAVAHTNRDFEDPAAAIRGWQAYAGLGYSVTRESSGGHSGAGFVRLRTPAADCDIDAGSAFILQHFRQPPHDRVTGGTRISFYYRYPNDATSVLRVNSGSEYLPSAQTWTKFSRCGASGAPGTLDHVRISLAHGGRCSQNEVDIDDVVVDTDPSCPIE